MGGPIEEIWGESLGQFLARARLGDVEDGKLRQRQDVDRGEGVGVVADGAVEGVLREAGGP